MATLPPTTPSQSASAVGPCAVIAPTPVTTTRMGSDIDSPEDERHVLSFETAGERECRADLELTRRAHDDVHVDLGVALFASERGRDGTVRDGHHRGGGVQRAR